MMNIDAQVKKKLDALFNPGSLAMIGASRDPSKWGFIVLSRILNGGYKGRVFPVNLREKDVLGINAFPSITDIPAMVEVAIICTPGPTVPGLVHECGRKGVKALIVITSGFSEVGREGADLEKDMVEIARGYNMILAGPNTMGIYSAGPSLNCLMAPVSPLPGKVACASQSGNVGTHMLFRGKMRNLGFSKFVSSGNEGDLTFEDYLEYFGQDDESNIITGYMEGIDPGSRFVDAAREAARRKPVIIYKGGRSEAGNQAAASHTGALAGSLEIFQGAFRQAGVISASSNKEVVELARALELQPLPKGNRVGILTRGGGWGVITADACAEAGLEVVKLREDTLARLDRFLPSYWSRGNPVDMVATLSETAYIDCLRIIANDPGVDGVLALGANIEDQIVSSLEAAGRFGEMSGERVQEMQQKHDKDLEKMVEAIISMSREVEKPVISVGRPLSSNRWDERLQMITEPEEAAHILAKMAEYSRFLQSINKGQ
jgi:acyl-CoA synthetase (NDP forming)